MAVLIEIASWLCIGVGVFLAFTGALGLLRLPDVFTRMHGAGMIDTLGTALILVGFMFQAGLTLVTVKLILIVVFLLYTSPATTHALARALLNAGVRPLTGRDAVAAAAATEAGKSGKEPEPSKT